eukprot:jgi/Galph1/4719/GphlegSOOS_G3376.1
MAVANSITELETRLLNQSNGVAVRMRSIFGFKGLGGPKAVSALSKCLCQDPSRLVRHEAAYALGQMRDKGALNVLEYTVLNEMEDPMVRHEAAEALGAIGCLSSIDVLQKLCYDDCCCREVRETCELAIKRIQSCNESVGIETFDRPTVDPVTVESWMSSLSTQETGEKFLDPSFPLFDRYRYLFALRDKGTPEAISFLCRGFRDDSALLKHEIAFVLGQLGSPQAVNVLKKLVEDKNEHYMVRHEAAEALGSIAIENVRDFLSQYLCDDNDVVRESCEVALDVWNFYESDDFHYTDILASADGN